MLGRVGVVHIIDRIRLMKNGLGEWYVVVGVRAEGGYRGGYRGGVGWGGIRV